MCVCVFEILLFGIGSKYEELLPNSIKYMASIVSNVAELLEVKLVFRNSD